MGALFTVTSIAAIKTEPTLSVPARDREGNASTMKIKLSDEQLKKLAASGAPVGTIVMFDIHTEIPKGWKRCEKTKSLETYDLIYIEKVE